MANQFDSRERKETNKVELENILTGFLNQAPKEAEQIEDIDYSKFNNLNMQSLITAKNFAELFSGVFSGQEIAQIVSNNQTTIDSLSTLAVACVYINKSEDSEFKLKIKDAALKGNFDYVLEQVAIEKGKFVTDDMVKKAIEEKIPTFLTSVETKDESKSLENKVSNKYSYSFENLKGALGKGMRLEFDGQFYEHRNLDKNTVLRITQNPANGKYQAIMHFGDVKRNKGFDSMVHLANIVNSTFGTDYRMNVKDYNAQNNLRNPVSLTPFSEWNPNTTNPEGFINNLYVKYNQENYYLNKNSSLRALDSSLDTEAKITGISMIVVAGAAMKFRLLLGLEIPLLANFFASATRISGFLTYLNKDSILSDFNNETFKKPANMEEMAKMLNHANKERETCEYPDISEFTKKVCEAQNMQLVDTFTNISLMKGYVVEFHSESLDNIYTKAYSISELLKKG